jgi:hypothetical protein
MPTAKGFVSTDRADRYLHQFSKHLAHGPGGIRAEDRPDGSLLIDVGNATCTLEATPAGLNLTAESLTRDALGRLQRQLGSRIEQIGHRDALSVDWNPAPPPADGEGGHRAHRHR